MEAVIAAVFLDGGLDAARGVVLTALEASIREQATGPGDGDYKTRLQELAAQVVDQLPRYQLRHEGPDHSKQFFASVLLRGEVYGTGEGRSKKAAEQAAAARGVGTPPARGGGGRRCLSSLKSKWCVAISNVRSWARR